MARRTFSIGGVHPADSKISRDCKLEYLPIPPTVYIALSQHIGAPAKPVVAVGENAFKGNTSVRTVTVPASVTSIGASAFAGCTSLSTVTLTNSVTSIGAAAFENCASLSNMRIGN